MVYCFYGIHIVHDLILVVKLVYKHIQLLNKLYFDYIKNIINLFYFVLLSSMFLFVDIDKNFDYIVPFEYYSILNCFCFEDDVKARRFFEPIIANLNYLQQHGLTVNGRSIKFSFSTMVADNLAAHQIGGFQSSFNNGYICRRCFIKHSDLHLPISQTRSDIRTSTYHDSLIIQINSNFNKSPVMGVVRQSPIYDLDGFHPIMSLPADLMHDYLEGICPLFVMSLLKEACAMRLLSYRKS